jgi:hypothetical protein
MNRLFSTKKRIAAVALVGVMIAGASGVAAAFFTSTGAGTGNVTVAQATKWAVGETGTPTGGPLVPDYKIGFCCQGGGGIGTGTPNVQTDTYYVNNPATAGIQNLTSVTISVAQSDGSVWSAQADGTKPACTAADFSVGGQAVGSAWTVTSLAGPFNPGMSKYGTVTVEMIDNGLIQNNCQGLAVPLYFSAS